MDPDLEIVGQQTWQALLPRACGECQAPSNITCDVATPTDLKHSDYGIIAVLLKRGMNLP